MAQNSHDLWIWERALGPRTWLVRLADHVRPYVLKVAGPREALLYQSALLRAETGAPLLHRAVPLPDTGRWLLLLEALPDSPPDFANPAQAAQAYAHLGAVHQRFVRRPPPLPPPPAARNVAGILAAAGLPAGFADRAGRTLAAGPETLLHGDYHRWNLAVADTRLRVVDWERAACGHPVWDLVWLTPEEAGISDWPGGSAALAALRAYHQTGPLRALAWVDFRHLLTLARLATSAELALRHEQRARLTPRPAMRAVMLEHAARERKRLHALRELCLD